MTRHEEKAMQMRSRVREPRGRRRRAVRLRRAVPGRKLSGEPVSCPGPAVACQCGTCQMCRHRDYMRRRRAALRAELEAGAREYDRQRRLEAVAGFDLRAPGNSLSGGAYLALGHSGRALSRG